jgi:hypothetical protein
VGVPRMPAALLRLPHSMGVWGARAGQEWLTGVAGVVAGRAREAWGPGFAIRTCVVAADGRRWSAVDVPNQPRPLLQDIACDENVLTVDANWAGCSGGPIRAGGPWPSLGAGHTGGATTTI